MPPISESHHVDPGVLARLVLQLRALRAEIERVRGDLPKPEDTPFLHRQLLEQVDALQEALGDLVPADADKPKRKGFLQKVFGRKRKPLRHPDLEGNAWTIPVSELIGFLSTARKTGILWVDSANERFVIEIKRGNLIRAMSNCTPIGLRLGELLVRHDALRQEDADEAVEAAKKRGLSLGGYLVESGRVTEKDVKQALSTQVQGLFDRLLSVHDAVYRFQEGVDIEDAKELDLNVTQLLLESARQLDESQFGAGLPSIIGLEPDLEEDSERMSEVRSSTRAPAKKAAKKEEKEKERDEAA